jgi:glycosyltransferase involved in cell wall biosynthesis
MAKLSSITIAGNEAANIADCIDSLKFCDERIVVDGGSKDDTVAIAEKHGATVYHHPWTNHGRQKNIALSHATGEWVLLLDADERVPPALAAEIRKAMEDSEAAGFEMHEAFRLVSRLRAETVSSRAWPLFEPSCAYARDLRRQGKAAGNTTYAFCRSSDPGFDCQDGFLFNSGRCGNGRDRKILEIFVRDYPRCLGVHPLLFSAAGLP